MTATPPPIAPQGPTGAFDDLFASEPMGAFDDLTPLMESVGTEMSQDFGEDLFYVSANAARSFADQAANLFTGAVKVGGGIGSWATGEGFAKGYEFMRQEMQSGTGTTDPGALDIVESIGRQIGALPDDGGPTAGVRFKEKTAQRISEGWQAFSEVGGAAVGFMVGPGAALGRGAESGSKLVSDWATRVAVRASASRAGIAREMVDTAISQGRGWEVLASMPQWQKNAGIVERMMGGVANANMRLVDTTAANIAQAYAMAPDDQRMAAARAAALSSPFGVPFARLGQRLASGIATKAIGIEDAKAIKSAFDSVGRGEMSLPQLDKFIREHSSAGVRATAHIVSGLAEGIGVSTMDPQVFEELRKAASGDMEAFPRLLGMWSAGVIGVIAGKGLLPGDLSPMFRTLRPDLNTLSTYIEAETNKRLAEMPAPEQEPKPLVSKMGEIDQPDAPSRNVPEMWVESNQRALKAQADAAAYEAQMRTTYGWAEGYADGPIRGGYVPEFAENGAVRLTQGRDFSMVLEKGDGTGPVLRLDPKIAQTLAAVGRPLTGYDPLAPTMVELRGADATRTLNDLTLLAQLRQMQGAVEYQKAGFNPVDDQPGVWRDPNGRFYTMQLDGTSANRTEYDGNVWRNVDDFATQGDLGPPRYDSEALQALEDILRKKAVMVPDPLVDATIGHALTIARYGEGVGADELRQFLETTDITRIVARFRNGVDREMAFDLAALALGNSNSTQAAQEAGAKQQPAAAGAGDSPLPADSPRSQAQAPPNPSFSPYGVGDVPMPQEQPFLMRARPLQSDSPPPQDFAGSLGAGVVPEAIKAVKDAEAYTRLPRKRMYDYIFEEMPEVVRKTMPNETLPFEVREVRSAGKADEGHAAKLFEPARRAYKTKEGKALLAERVEVPGDPDAQQPAWVPLYKGLEKPRTTVQKTIFDASQAAGMGMWDAAREAGIARIQDTPDGPKWKQLEKRKISVPQLVAGKHNSDVFNNEALRKGYFASNIKTNPGTEMWVKDADSGRMVRKEATVEMLNNEWVEKQISKGDGSTDKAAATEFMRRFNNVGYWWKGPDGIVREVWEPNPMQVMSHMVKRQPFRTASVRKYGQSDIPEDARRAILEDPESSPELKANVQRGGVDKRLKEFEKAVAKLPDTNRKDELKLIGKTILTELQGVNAEPTSPMVRGFRPWTSMHTAAMAAKGFAQDIPELYTRGAIYVGHRVTMDAIKKYASNPKEADAMARELGTMPQTLGDWSMTEAKRWWQSAADLFGYPAGLTERAKAGVATEIANILINRWKSGRRFVNDPSLLQDILRMSAEDTAAFMKGEFSDAKATQFRQEFVGLYTGRVRPGEGSRLAHSKTAAVFVPLMKWWTKRTSDNVRTIAAWGRVAKRHGWKSPEAWAAAGRVVKQFTIGPAGSTLGKGIGMVVTGMFAMEVWDEGIKKAWDWMSESWSRAYLAGLEGQFVGGPASNQMRLLRDPNDVNAAVGVTHMSAMAYSGIKALQAIGKGDFFGMGLALLNPYVPFRSDIGVLYTAAVKPEAVKQAAFDARYVREFMRDEGIKTAYGSRGREPQFYEAIAGIVDKVRVAEMKGLTVESALKESMVEIRAALDLAPEDSVAGAIEGHQLVRHLNDAQRVKLSERINDKERMDRIYKHDEALRDIASVVRRKLDGVNPTEWRLQMDQVRSQALLGASDRWGALVDRTLDDAVQARLGGQDHSDYINELSETLAEFPEHLERALGEEAAKNLDNPAMDTLSRARRIAGILRRRMNLRIKAERTRDAKDRAKEARGV